MWHLKQVLCIVVKNDKNTFAKLNSEKSVNYKFIVNVWCKFEQNKQTKQQKSDISQLCETSSSITWNTIEHY